MAGPNLTDSTYFPNGIAVVDGWAEGGTAGNFTPVGVVIATTDKLVQAIAIKAAATPLDLTGEFSITAANIVNNTGGTATTGYLLQFKFALKKA